MNEWFKDIFSFISFIKTYINKHRNIKGIVHQNKNKFFLSSFTRVVSNMNDLLSFALYIKEGILKTVGNKAVLITSEKNTEMFL